MSFYLNPPSIQAQCSAAINNLLEESQELVIANGSICEFISDEELNASGFETLKNQMRNYMSVISALMSAISIDIQDYKYLSGAVGIEVLDGDVIEKKIEEAKGKKDSFRNKAQEFRNEGDISNEPLIYNWKYAKADLFDAFADLEQKKEEHWQEKVDKYIQIESDTASLFCFGNSIRSAAADGLSALGKNFQNGVFTNTSDGAIAEMNSKVHRFESQHSVAFEGAGFELFGKTMYSNLKIIDDSQAKKIVDFFSAVERIDDSQKTTPIGGKGLGKVVSRFNIIYAGSKAIETNIEENETEVTDVVSDVVVETGNALLNDAIQAGCVKIGTAVGTLCCPGIGTLVGSIAGYALGLIVCDYYNKEIANEANKEWVSEDLEIVFEGPQGEDFENGWLVNQVTDSSVPTERPI